jgi:hypothetical protein
MRMRKTKLSLLLISCICLSGCDPLYQASICSSRCVAPKINNVKVFPSCQGHSILLADLTQSPKNRIYHLSNGQPCKLGVS